MILMILIMICMVLRLCHGGWKLFRKQKPQKGWISKNSAEDVILSSGGVVVRLDGLPSTNEVVATVGDKRNFLALRVIV